MEFGLVALWLIAFLGLGVLSLPLAAWLLDDIDHAAFAIPVSLAVLAVVAHLVGYLAFGLPAALASLIALAILSAIAYRRMEYSLRADLRASGEHAVVFVFAFVLVVGIRGLDPAAAPLPLAIGEKFLDFGLLNTLDRTGTLPPEDMWFAGETVRYHYGGHMITVLLATLTGTETAFAYNLGLAGFYATLVTAAYGLAGSIVHPLQISRRLAGGLGAFFVGVAGNLEPLGRVLVWLAPDTVAQTVASSLGYEDQAVHWLPTQFWYFDASRVIPVDPSLDDPAMAASEFPLFAWLNGDLHAHMMVQPFVLLLVALLLAAWRAPLSRRRGILFGAVPPVVGVVGLVDIWTVPVALGLVGLTVFFCPGESPIPIPAGSTSRIGTELLRLVSAVAVVVAVATVAVFLTLPYWLDVVLGGPGGSFSYWEPWTPLFPLLLVHGAFLIAIGIFLARVSASRTQSMDRIAGMLTPGIAFAAFLGVVAVTALLGAPAVGLVVPIIAVCWWLLRTGENPGFELVLIAAGAGLVLLVELVTIDGERFNVIFKPYVHVWLFWAVATAVVLPRLASASPVASDVDTSRLRQHGAVLAVVLVAVTGLYAGFAIPMHASDGTQTTGNGPTLDATAYLEDDYPAEAEAIRWIDDRAGQPTILTAAPAGYFWVPEDGDGAAAPASLTGVPTVLGWTHQRQYRGTGPYQTRLSDVRTMYTDEQDRQSTLFEAYSVDYIYVGPAERNRYPTVTVDDHDAVSVAHTSGDVTIYEVDHENR